MRTPYRQLLTLTPDLNEEENIFRNKLILVNKYHM